MPSSFMNVVDSHDVQCAWLTCLFLSRTTWGCSCCIYRSHQKQSMFRTDVCKTSQVSRLFALFCIKVKRFSYIRYQELGPELIPVYMYFLSYFQPL